MVKSPETMWAAGFVAIGLYALWAPATFGAVGADEPQMVAGLASPAPRNLENAVDVELRFVQEDGPESGHVRVELVPENRALSAFEARAVAQQGFLEALSDPGLGENLTRVTVVVRLTPGPGAVPPGAEQSFLFLHKGGQNWSILRGE